MRGSDLQRMLDFKDDPAYVTSIAIDPSRSYRVATTDYLANVSAYRQFFSGVEKSGVRARDQIRRWIASNPQ